MNFRILHPFLILCIIFLTSSLHSQLTINEFMADNETTISDESGDFEDWIEIYNGGSSPVDIGGYYITDDATELTLWQIPDTDPASTTIAAGAYLLLWADKDTDDGVLHIDLKLSNNGEDIVLVQPDGTTIVDQLTFGSQNTDVSYGRTSDGGGSFQLFTNPTPGTSNEAPQSGQTFPVTVKAIVASVNDDAIQYGTSGGSVNIDHFGMKMTESWSNQTIGVRFDNIPIPQGAIITKASIQFATKSEDQSTGYSNLNIKGELSGDAAIFIEENKNISNRVQTDASVIWEPAEWLIQGESGDRQRTPDLSVLLQEIIDQNSWQNGNAIAFIITGEGTRSAHNFTSGNPPSILIEAEIPVSTQPVADIYINEITPNGTDYTDEFGGHEDWIELYNDNDFPVALGGLYLTDNIDDLTKWQIKTLESIPANGFMTIFADEEPFLGGLHADFKLNEDGETVALVQAINNELIIIDSFTYENIPFKASIGRITETATEWTIFGSPTPLQPNAGAAAWLDKPHIDLDHGVFTTTQSVTITHVDPEVIIRYTTDGSDPDENDEEYTGPITVTSTQSIRARAFKNGHAPSQIRTRNYLFDPSETLPVVMITTDPDNLFDDEIGIYTVGTNGIMLGNCSNNVVANFWQDWERPATISLFEKDGEEAFSVDAGIKISGNCSRRYALKSLNIYLRNNRYGDKNIDYELFPNRDFKKYKRLRLRNSGQDYRGTMLRDGVNHRILAGITDVEYQSYRPALVYINGEYYGIQNFRDLYGGDYFDAFFDVKEEDLDLIKNPRLGNDVKEGDDNHYNNLYSFVLANDLSEVQNYEYFKTQFDINNFIDYWIAMIYMASSDWPANNLQIWRPRTSDGKWRHMYIDTDATTNIYGTNSATAPTRDTYNKVLDANQSGWPYDSKSTLFLRKLLENETFRDEYIQRTCSFIELVFNEERVHGIINAAKDEIDAEIGRHTEHWAFDNPYLENYEDWSNKIESYRNFFSERPDYFYAYMVDNFDLGDTYELSFNYDENTKGDVFVNWNSMGIPFNYTGTYFTGIPMRIKAVADEGYIFSHWLETGDTNPEIDFIANFDAVLTPIFEPLGEFCNPDSPDFQDEDADGVCDLEDECPGFDDLLDTNANGIPDGCEPCFEEGDDDLDGVCNDLDQCPGFDDNIDNNNNGVPDACEECTDHDNDGFCESEDCDDENPNLPALPGSPCDDGDDSTDNDTIAEDGCTCIGIIIPSDGEYCEAEGDFPWHDWIARVQLNTIDNSSGKSPYSDFTTIGTTLLPNQTYDLHLTTGYSWTTYQEYWKVWIDYNQDGIFSESAELAYSGTLIAPPNGTETATLSAMVSIPLSAKPGETRMRIVMSRDADSNACGINPFGEVEDYSIVVGSSGNMMSSTFNNFENKTTPLAADVHVFPNPVKETLHLLAPEYAGLPVSILIYNHLGQMVYFSEETAFPSTRIQIDMHPFSDGFYYVVLKNEDKKRSTKKFILERK